MDLLDCEETGSAGVFMRLKGFKQNPVQTCKGKAHDKPS